MNNETLGVIASISTPHPAASCRTQAAIHSGGQRLLAELPQIIELTRSLAWRDIRVRYKHSILGIGWAVMLPIAIMLVFTFVFTRAVDGVALLGVDIPYPLYAFAGIVPWTFFAGSLNGCVNSLVANRSLVTKIYFPREVFPFSCVAAGLFDFAVALAVLAALMACFHAADEWQFRWSISLAFVPVIVAVQIAFVLGLGMIAAMGNLFFRDVRQLVTVGVQLWMFVSGVVVPVPRDGSWLSTLLMLNPAAPIIGAYRDCILYGRLPELAPFAYAAMVAAFMLLCGWIWFRRAAGRFAECI